MAFLIAWRNVLINRRRTLVTMLLSIVSTVFLIFYVSIFYGVFDKSIKDAIEIYSGYMQVSAKGYKDSPSYEKLIFDAKEQEKALKEEKGVASVAERFETFALLATDKLSIGSLFVGVEPELETKHSKINENITSGRWLDKEDRNSVVIGYALAKKLDLKVGDTIAYISTAVDYSFTADNLTVVGIFNTGFRDLDKRFAFVNKTYMDEMFLTDGIVTSFAILPKNSDDVERIKAQIEAGDKGVEVKTWEEFISSVLDLVEMKKTGASIMIGTLMVIILFVFIVYAIIAVFSRTTEIGILRSIGSGPIEIFMMLMYEALIIGLIAVAVGAVLGGYLAWYFQVHPIALGGEQFEAIIEQSKASGFKMDPYMAAVFSWPIIGYSSLFVLVLNLVAVIYPAIKVIRKRPIDAIHNV